MKSTNKLENYLETYTREKYFTDRVAKIRKEIGIPKNGISFPDPAIADNAVNFADIFFEIKHKNVSYRTYERERTPIYNELLKPVPKIYQDTPLVIFFNIFILYNELHYEIFEQFCGGMRNTASLIEYRNEYLERKDTCDCETKVCENYMNNESAIYPVMIGISPYATQNEVVDLIKKQWDHIQSHMAKLAKENNLEPFSKEAKQLSQIRKRKTTLKEIEDLVYENKGLSLKDIATLVRTQTGKLFDQAEIGKIKSLAVKRRGKIRK